MTVSGRLLNSYRVFAYATGLLLVTLTAVSLPSWIERLLAWEQDEVYTGETPEWLALLWTAHGWFYMGYLLTAFLLTLKLRWSVPRSLGVLLAGTVPGMSFVAERWVVREVRVFNEQALASPAASSDPPAASEPGEAAIDEDVSP